MIPNIVIFGKEFTPYLLMALCGIFTVGILACIKSKKCSIDDNETICVLLFAALGVIFGSHLLYAITNIPFAIKILPQSDSLKKLLQALNLIFGGSVFYGGLFGGLFAAKLYIHFSKLDSKFFMWLLTPYIPLFHFFGRLGCFLSGCCYGIECNIGFVYNHSLIEEANHVSRFPIQLVESILNLSLFFILTKLQKNEKAKSHLLEIYLGTYAIIRFTDEFFRGDSIRGIWFGLSTSQIISIIVLLVIGRRQLQKIRIKKASLTCQQD